MVAIKAQEVSRALRSPDPAFAVILLYGPDAGLVAERARGLAHGVVSDPADPFLLVKIDGDSLADDPARLADEAGTIGMFGGRRVIWVRVGSKNVAPAVEAALSADTGDSLIVVEAGDLAKSAPLRNLCEKTPRALAAPCYADDGKDLAALVDDSFRKAGIAVSRETRALLLDSLGADRLATRSEIEKLLLYAYGQERLEYADVEAVIADVSALRGDLMIDAAFAGDAAQAEDYYRRLLGEGSDASQLASSMLRHALALLPHAAAISGGQSPARAVDNWRGLHFKRRSAVQRHLGSLDAAILQSLVERLQACVLDMRRDPELKTAFGSRMILEIAARARRGARAG
ncbi:MAG: DNA polymerase III subunit delta [Salinarimonadaceae bacterium]|nr:MAG: DNA polymerase III subunit delta [Salinarimonadaceae bacterium]